MAHIGEHVAKGVGVAGHLEADVESFLHVELLLDVLERRGAWVDGQSDSDFFSELAAVFVGVGDDDVARAGVTGHGCSHDADGACSCDKDVFAEDGKSQRGVDGVAERVEDCGDLVGDAGGVDPDVRHREDDVFGEGSVAIDADA